MNVVIVDDDREVVEMLSNLVDWARYDCTILLKAFSGDEVLQNLDGRRIDLLISDITMPGMDGYELTSILAEQNPDLLVIFLTCHDEFQYAKDAIQVGADDYLIKYALTRETLEKSLERLFKENKEKVEKRRFVEMYEADVSENALLFKEGLLHRFLREGPSPDVSIFTQKLASYGIEYPSGAFSLIGYFLRYDIQELSPDYKPNLRTRLYQVAEVVSSVLRSRESRDEVFPCEDFIILIHDGTELPETNRSLAATVESIYRRLQDELGLTVSICASDVFASLAQLSVAIENLHKRSFNNFYVEEMIDLRQKDAVFYPLPHDRFDDFLQRFKLSFAKNDDFLEDMAFQFKKLKSNQYDPTQVRRLIQLCLTHIYHATVKLGRGVPVIQVKDRSFQFCKDAIQTQYSWCTGQYDSRVEGQGNRDITAVIRYVDTHLRDELSLQLVAEKIGKNSSYLSRLFKQNMGKSFTEFFIQRRIGHATRLLEETTLPIEDIGREIGIQNTSYFYRFYKRETGRTPGEVRTMIKQR